MLLKLYSCHLKKVLNLYRNLKMLNKFVWKFSRNVRDFSKNVGITKRDSIIDIVRLENTLRQELNKHAPRVLSVIDPLKIVITNYPDGEEEMMEAINNPEDINSGTRYIPFSKEIFIEKSDFMEDPPKKYFRLSPGREVRLRYTYFITCTDMIKDGDGNIIEIHCTYAPESKGGTADGRKVKATLHWVSAPSAINAEVRLYDRLFIKENPDEEGKFLENLNPNSCIIYHNAKLEPSLKSASNKTYQFERLGYFKKDESYSNETRDSFIRVVSLRDSWARFLKQNNNVIKK